MAQDNSWRKVTLVTLLVLILAGKAGLAVSLLFTQPLLEVQVGLIKLPLLMPFDE